MLRRVALALICATAVGCSALGSSTARPSTTAPTDAAPETTAGSTSDPAPTQDAEGVDATSDTDDPGEAAGALSEPTAPLSGSFTARAVEQFPHDADAYTQGLEFVGDRLLESTGRYGESDRRWVDLATGEVEAIVDLDDQFFGEGLTVVDDRIIQITWRAGQAIVSDLELNELQRFTYEGEGWGLCYDGAELVMSNGSSSLTFRDPNTFEPVRTTEVTRADGELVPLLNELECIGSQVFANIYTSDEIVVIDPTSGEVEASIDASPLRPDGLPLSDADFALNGIAYQPATGQYFLTGKWWPVLYEVEFAPTP